MNGWSDEALENGEFCVDDAARGCADGNVVGEDDEFDIQDCTLSHTAHGDAGTVLKVAIETRLWAIGFLVDIDGVKRGRGAGESLGDGGVGNESLADLLGARGRPAGEANGDGHGMAIDDGDAVAGRRDAEGMGSVHVEGELAVVVLDDAAEDLEGLPFDLFFLAGDVGDDVVGDVEGGDAGVARAGDGLHGGDDARVEGSERALEGTEGDDEAGGGAVGVGEDEATVERGRVEGLLLGDHRKVGGVGEGDDEGNTRIPAVGLGVGEDGEIGGPEGALWARGQRGGEERRHAGTASSPMSPATSASRPEKTTRQSWKWCGLQSWTIMSRTAAGMGADCFHCTALA